MGWCVGWDGTWQRDIGYGVPAVCDHPECEESIDRGLSYVCGGQPYGGADGCCLYFCGNHLGPRHLCERCQISEPSFTPKSDVAEWLHHKLTDETWAAWRDDNPEEVAEMKEALKQHTLSSQEIASVERIPGEEG